MRCVLKYIPPESPDSQIFATPPVANLIVIRSPDIHRAVRFYTEMGILFVLHSHGNGPEHFASDICGFIFEIYPQRSPDQNTTNVRIGFNVDDVDGIVELLQRIGGTIVSKPADSEWGRRAVVKDFDGHTVELVTPPGREPRILENYKKAHRASDG